MEDPAEEVPAILEQVWLGNMRHNITVKEIEDYIKSIGFKDFAVRRTHFESPGKDGCCFVQFNSVKNATKFKRLVHGQAVPIRKCMPHRYSQCEN